MGGITCCSVVFRPTVKERDRLRAGVPEFSRREHTFSRRFSPPSKPTAGRYSKITHFQHARKSRAIHIVTH